MKVWTVRQCQKYDGEEKIVAVFSDSSSAEQMKELLKILKIDDIIVEEFEVHTITLF